MGPILMKGARSRKLLTLAGIATALLLTAACASSQPEAPTGGGGAAQETPRRGGILDMATAVAAEPTDLEPLKSAGFGTSSLLGQTSNGLLAFDSIENTKIVPELAERWEVSPDGKTYTFFLHKGVKWHDGVPFSAADAKYTLDRMRDPKDPFATNLATKRDLFNAVERIEVVDDNTLRLVLGHASNSILPALAFGSLIIVPKHAYDQGLDMNKTVIGTGGYKLSDYQRGAVFKVVRNPDFFLKDRPYLDGINTYFLKDNATRVAAFTTGQIKFLGYIYKPEVEAIKKDVPQAVITTNDGLRNGFIGFNNEKPPFNDARVRRAISLVVDRSAALKLLVQGDGRAGTLLSPDISQFPPEELNKQPGYRADKTQDIAEAKRLLAEAGYPNGFKSVLSTRVDQDYQDLAIFAKDQMAKIGIDVSINILATALYTSERLAGNFEMIAIGGVAYFTDPSGGVLYFGPSNFLRWKNQDFMNLIDRQDAEQNPAERNKLLRQMEETWLKDAPYVMFYWKTHSAAVYPEVRGYKIGTGIYNNQHMRNVWLAQ